MDVSEFQRLLQLFPTVRSRDYTVLLSLSLLFVFLGFFLILYFYYSPSQISLLCCFKFRFLRYPCCQFRCLGGAFSDTQLPICLYFVFKIVLFRLSGYFRENCDERVQIEILIRSRHELGLFDIKKVVPVLKQGRGIQLLIVDAKEIVKQCCQFKLELGIEVADHVSPIRLIECVCRVFDAYTSPTYAVTFNNFHLLKILLLFTVLNWNKKLLWWSKFPVRRSGVDI